MEGFHDDYPQYEFMSQHSDEEGVVKRKKLWQVFWIMLAITIIELFIGFKAAGWGVAKTTLIFTFIFFTIVKAYYIVYRFMHLGHEKSALKWVIIGPYATFIIYLAFMLDLGEGSYSENYRHDMDRHITVQQFELKSGHHTGHSEAKEAGQGEGEHHEGGEHHE